MTSVMHFPGLLRCVYCLIIAITEVTVLQYCRKTNFDLQKFLCTVSPHIRYTISNNSQPIFGRKTDYHGISRVWVHLVWQVSAPLSPYPFIPSGSFPSLTSIPSTPHLVSIPPLSHFSHPSPSSLHLSRTHLAPVSFYFPPSVVKSIFHTTKELPFIDHTKHPWKYP